MSKDYPSEELLEVIELPKSGVLCTSAGEWAQSAMITVENSQETVDLMRNNSVEAPTEAQNNAMGTFTWQPADGLVDVARPT